MDNKLEQTLCFGEVDRPQNQFFAMHVGRCGGQKGRLKTIDLST